MRHAAGGQSNKYCKFMFDEIDRIFVGGSKDFRKVSDEVFGGWSSTVPERDRDRVSTILHNIRTTPKRKDLENLCLDFKNGTTTYIQKDGKGFGKYITLS